MRKWGIGWQSRWRSREDYNRRMRAVMAMRYKKRKQEATLALGGRCQCGATEHLHFDHINPGGKVLNITRIFSFSEDRFWNEVAKCQLLCQDCHLDKTLREKGQHRAKGVHGTLANYATYKCRCEECREAARQYVRRYRAERKIREPGWVHG